MEIRPIKNRVLVRQVAARPKTASGLYVPQGSEEHPPYGQILALGPTAFEDYPEADRPKVGDWVLFQRRPGSALNPDIREGRSDVDDLLMLRDEDLVGVLDAEPEL